METPRSKSSFTCFVIMPFSDTAHEAAGVQKITCAAEWTNIFQDWIKKTVESYPDANITCERSATAAGNFVKGIVGSLNDSHFVIADLTGNKPNVYYELGIRHALRTGTIIITQHRSALPSDLQTYYCLEYSYSSAHHEYATQYAIFEEEIHGLIRAIFEQNFSSDSPVSDFLGFEHYVFAKEWQAERNEVISQLNNCLKLFGEQIQVLRDMAVLVNQGKRIIKTDTFMVDLLYSRFFNYRWKVLNADLVELIRKELFSFRQYCNAAYQFNENVPSGTDPWSYIIKCVNNCEAVVGQLWMYLNALKIATAPVGQPLATTDSE